MGAPCHPDGDARLAASAHAVLPMCLGPAASPAASLSCPARIDLGSQPVVMSHARLVGRIQHWLQPDSAVLSISAPWDSAVMQMYKDCTSLDDEMDRVIGELLEGRRRSALDDCLRLIRWAGWG